MSASTCLPASSSISPKTTFAPSRAKSLASVAPWPRAPPLIRATLPSSRPMLCSFSGKMLSYGAGCDVLYAHPTGGAVAFSECEGEEQRVTAASDLEAFVRPRSIAVVGASERTDAWGNWLFRKLLDEGFPGRLYPINRQAQTILGQPAYAQVSAVPGPVDLAIIAIPAPHIF